MKDVKYFCNGCKQYRKLTVDLEQMVDFVKNESGLTQYSDIHTCKNGVLGINNLYIDHNFDVRSYELLELPKHRILKKISFPIPGLPTPKSKNQEGVSFKEITITHIDENNDFRVIISDQLLGSNINIGKVNINKEIPFATVYSDIGSVSIAFYSSNIPFTETMETWLNLFVNTIEILPPTEIGLIIETLRYILEYCNERPSDFDNRMIKTIIASHEIFILPKDERKLDIAQEKYPQLPEFDIDKMKKLMEQVKENNKDELNFVPLQRYTTNYDDDMTHLIYTFLIMEKIGVIEIERPGIIDEIT